jgi:hypothetical protein
MDGRIIYVRRHHSVAAYGRIGSETQVSSRKVERLVAADRFEYAVAALAGRGIDEDLARLDDMRQIRNDAEYRVRRVGDADVRADLASVERVIAVIEADLTS